MLLPGTRSCFKWVVEASLKSRKNVTVPLPDPLSCQGRKYRSLESLLVLSQSLVPINSRQCSAVEELVPVHTHCSAGGAKRGRAAHSAAGRVAAL